MDIKLEYCEFAGFAKLYTGANQMLGNVCVMHYHDGYMYRYAFFLCKTGKMIYTCDLSTKKESDFGIEYIEKFEDDKGQVYYITPITKSITIDF